MYTLQGLYIHSRESPRRLCGLWVEFTGTLHGVYIEYVHCSGTLCKLVGVSNTAFVHYCTEYFLGKLWRKDSHGAHKIVPLL
jgi:hypothetical protein